uniref:TonB C-terminal domain-containing protein n=1 Tax=mine drainage metagenome TaxID=410659 RepID=E6QL68_9ZZZZ
MSRILIASLLLSSSVFSASAMASQPITDASTSNAAPTAYSTYSAPRMLSSTDIHISSEDLPEGIPSNASMIVALNVDTDGHAKNVRVVRSFSPEISFRVVEALSHARFQPAILNRHAISAPMTIQVAVQR